jgi:GNAT superfamily N-acetyltransferase
MTRTDVTRVAEARRWFKLLGHEPVRGGGATIVATPDWPDTWDANFALPEPGATAAGVIGAMDRHMPHTRWRVVAVDALTDPAFEAEIALADFAPRTTLIEMLAPRITAHRGGPAITTQLITDGAGWNRLEPLVRADHREGLRTGTVDAAVSNGLLSSMRRRAPPCEYQLILIDGEAVGYGMTVRCPNGLALIEELFTLPAWRKRGAMSAFIAAEFARLTAQGCDAMFLDAHAHDTPKHLYAQLGFAPVAVTRHWVREELP